MHTYTRHIHGNVYIHLPRLNYTKMHLCSVLTLDFHSHLQTSLIFSYVCSVHLCVYVWARMPPAPSHSVLMHHGFPPAATCTLYVCMGANMWRFMGIFYRAMYCILYSLFICLFVGSETKCFRKIPSSAV